MKAVVSGSISVPAQCWLHPAVHVAASPIAGRGVFAREAIAEHSVVARLGGRLVTRAELEALFAAAASDPAQPYVDSISLEPGVDLVLPPDQPIHFVNHSCDPNLWHADAVTLTARRDLAAGEELTIDYATHTDSPTFSMRCTCGSTLCRSVVTGSDWRRPELQARYGTHWVPALLARMRVG